MAKLSHTKVLKENKKFLENFVRIKLIKPRVVCPRLFFIEKI